VPLITGVVSVGEMWAAWWGECSAKFAATAADEG
jgi:hypothetical protein